MLNIYVANLGKYNEGDLVGSWIELPTTEEEMKQILTEKVGINKEYEEWAIHDYDTDIHGLTISEYTNIFKLNEFAEQIENLDKDELIAFKAYIEDGCTIEDSLKYTNDSNFVIYNDCSDMSEVAEKYLVECGSLFEIPESLRDYFDFEKYGTEMEYSSNFHCIDNDYVELTY